MSYTTQESSVSFCKPNGELLDLGACCLIEPLYSTKKYTHVLSKFASDSLPCTAHFLPILKLSFRMKVLRSLLFYWSIWCCCQYLHSKTVINNGSYDETKRLVFPIYKFSPSLKNFFFFPSFSVLYYQP